MTHQLIEFPDTDILAVNMVHSMISTPDVAQELPSPIPDRFIRCFTIPGREVCPRVITCRVVTRVYDLNGQSVRCLEVARRATSVLRSAPEIPGDGTTWVSEPCERQGPYPIQDPEVPNRICYESIVTWTVHSEVTTVLIKED